MNDHFLHHTSRPRVVEKNGRSASDPNSNHWILVFLAPFFETVPCFRFGQLQNIPDDRQEAAQVASWREGGGFSYR